MVGSKLWKEKSEDRLKISFTRKGINPVSANNWPQKLVDVIARVSSKFLALGEVIEKVNQTIENAA